MALVRNIMLFALLAFAAPLLIIGPSSASAAPSSDVTGASSVFEDLAQLPVGPSDDTTRGKTKCCPGVGDTDGESSDEQCTSSSPAVLRACSATLFVARVRYLPGHAAVKRSGHDPDKLRRPPRRRS
ncbi:MAG: hypothetical protein AAGJ70_11430 [Pseudomonadota bacterium]